MENPAIRRPADGDPPGPARPRSLFADPLADLLVALVVVLVGIVGYKLSPAYRTATERVMAADPGCDLHRRTCSVALPFGTLEIDASPRPVPVLQPLTVSLHTIGFEARRIDIDFAGVGMAMGLNRPQAEATGPGRYRAATTLPVCVSGGMEWEMRVLLDVPGQGQVVVPVRFTTPEANRS